MDLVRKCFLLALVGLWGPAGGVDDEACWREALCEVTGVVGHEASVTCGSCPDSGARDLENRTSTIVNLNCNQTNASCSEKVLQVDLRKNDSNVFFQNRTLTKRTIITLPDNHTRNDAIGDHNFDSNRRNQLINSKFSNITKISSKGKETNLVILKDGSSELDQISKAKQQHPNCTRDKSYNNFANITILKINLNNSSTLDLTQFPNVSSLYLRGKNITVTKVCGAKDISFLTVQSTQLKNTTFLKSFKNLKFLNLTKNDLNMVPLEVLFLPTVTLDISKNKVKINTTINLPNNLKFINMSYNEIQLDVNVTMNGNFTVLDLSKNNLKLVPRIDSKTIEELYLSNNYISSLTHDDLTSMSSLIVLDLRENKLSRLEDKTFEPLTRLQKLDLSKNKIVLLAPSSFQFLNNLLTLFLSENQNLGHLQDVEDASFLFGTGQRLQTIEASKINLIRIPTTLTRSVRKLLLRNNQIATIQCGEMDSFPLLQVMDLSNNLISDVEEDSLGRLDFLSHLILYGNNLTSIPKSLPNQLQVLDLRLNCIEHLHNFDFLGLQKLKVLLLSNNRIESIQDGSFGQLVSLDILELSHNPIKSLSRTSFMGPRKLKEIYLISLTDLIPFEEQLSFPAPESAHLEVLNMESSPVLASQLMDDVAALTMFHELYELNLNHCRLSTLRSDLPKYLPRLHKLELSGNKLNCTNIIWLVRWLQTLNISMQSTGKFRREIYNLKDICCEDIGGAASYNQAEVMCSSPEYLSGRQIISLKEEDFPDLKLTSSTLPPREVLVTELYQQQTSAELESDTLELIDSSSTTSSIYNTTNMASEELSTLESTTPIYQDENELLASTKKFYPKENNFFRNTTTKKPFIVYNTTKPPLRVNHANNIWKYSKVEARTLSSDATVDLLNASKSITKDLDNHSHSVSSGAFLSHDPPHSQSSHPGMVLFLLVVGVILIAASFTVYSQCVQGWQGRDYLPQQDIEVSSLGGNDLW